MATRFPSRGHRAFFAWQCLPRDAKGAPPSLRSLERAKGLKNKDLSRLINDVYERPSYGKMQLFAAALCTTPEWLESEEGPAPAASWPVPVRPEPPPGMRKIPKTEALRKKRTG